MSGAVAHPARYSAALYPILRAALVDCRSVLDPFAGVGGIHDLGPEWDTVGVELEPEWACQRAGTIVGNALRLPFPDAAFDGICTSCVYGNRMSDHHDARDDSQRITYRHTLGRPLHPDNAGSLQWGPAYRIFHDRAWGEAVRVLRPGGRFVLNVKDHDRANKRRRSPRQPVAAWHVANLVDLHGLTLDRIETVDTPGMGYGAHLHDGGRYPEMVAVLTKAPVRPPPA